MVASIRPAATGSTSSAVVTDAAAPPHVVMPVATVIPKCAAEGAPDSPLARGDERGRSHRQRRRHQSCCETDLDARAEHVTGDAAEARAAAGEEQEVRDDGANDGRVRDDGVSP